MKKLIKISVQIFCIIALLIQNTFFVCAQSTTEIPKEYNLCVPGYTIFFVNGMNTLERDALVHLERYLKNFPVQGLTKEGNNHFYKGEPVKFDLIYNTSAIDSTNDKLGLAADTFEFLRQKKVEGHQDPLYTIVALSQKLRNKVITLFSPEKQNYLDTVQKAVDQKYLDDLQKMTDNLNNYYVGNKSEIDKSVKKIENELLEKKKVIVFAHSQGNLFSQQIYTQLKSEYKNGAIKWVNIGTPAASAITGSYITNFQDKIINNARTFGILNILPANVNLNDKYKNDPLQATGHSWRDVYMNSMHTTQYQMIQNAYKNSLDTLTVANTSGRTGAFTVALNWDGTGDIDLHIIEPTGNEVYFSNPNGNVGFLDTDNTRANGPEHYSASCDARKVTEGTYQVFAKNYARGIGRTATLFSKSSLANMTGADKQISFSTASQKTKAFDVKVTNHMEGNNRVFKVEQL
jgi:hypothetical protein